MLDHLKTNVSRYFGAWTVGGTVLLLVMFVSGVLILNDTKKVMLTGTDQAVFLKANNRFEHWKGLSWKSSERLLEKADGMVFLFGKEKARTFWMRGMQFDLDIIWIKDGKVVKIDSGIPAPLEGENPVVVSSAPFEVDAVIEVPAGMANKLGIKRGRVYEELQ